MPTRRTSSVSPSVWAGRLLSVSAAAILLADAAAHLLAPERVRPLMEASGFAAEQAPLLGGIILVCAILYAVPRTSFLGAILVTGFLGGAVCAHFRLGEFGSPPQLIALALGAMAWGGLYLRDPRLRQMLPVRTAGGDAGGWRIAAAGKTAGTS